MPLDETLNIDTPENVTFDYDIAGIGSRFIAALIDTLIILALQVVVNMLMFAILSSTGAVQGGLDEIGSLGAWVIALFGLVSFLFLWGYYIFFEMLWSGQTPGKKTVHLRVIRTDGTPITLTESVVRNLVRLVDFLPAFYGIGTIAIFINRQTRRLGDLAAGTLVVREKDQQVTLKDLAAMHAAASSSSLPRYSPEEQPLRIYPIERLSYQDIQMIESFLQRKKELTNRDALAQQLHKRLLAKMGVEEEHLTGANPENALNNILTEYRQYKQMPGG